MSDALERQERRTIGGLIRQGAPAWSPAEEQAAWFRLRRKLAPTRETPGAARRRLATLALAGIAVAVPLVGMWGAARGWLGAGDRRALLTPALAYEVEQGVLERDAAARPKDIPAGAEQRAALRGSDLGGTRLRFSDGTSVALRRAARAQVTSVDAAGARVALLEGEIAVDVVHRPASRWRFDAGPFSVFVEGTSFSLGWEHADQRLRLQMYAGVVTVKGPLAADAIRVVAGQTLTVRMPAQDIVLERSPVAPPAAPPSMPAPPAPDRAPVPSPPGAHPGQLAPLPAGPPSRSAPMARATSWRELIAAGRSAQVVADATSRGLELTLARGRREDLAALADAARYNRRNDLARDALRALRERFRSSDSARDAAFFLGLVEEADDPRSPRSLEWYRRYRLETPQGLYVSDALAREILLEQRIHGPSAARAAAREYLTRFPHGALAAEAARIAAP